MNTNGEHGTNDDSGGFVNTPHSDSTNGPEDQAANGAHNSDVNGSDATGNVVPFRPNIPRQGRNKGADVNGPDPSGSDSGDTSATSAVSYEVELDDSQETSTGPVPVDVPASSGERRPIIPPSLQPQNLGTTVKRTAGRWAYNAGFHAVRSPWYGLKMVAFSVRGLVRLIKLQLTWWWVHHHFQLLQNAANANDAKEWAKTLILIKSTRLWRGIVLTAELVAVAVGIPVAWHTVPHPYLWTAAGVAAFGLAHYGRPIGHNILGTAVVAPRFRKLNSDIVLRAYYAAGLGRADRPDQEVRFGTSMSRDARNTGSQVVIDLPYGKGWSDVLAAKEKIASGLDVHVNQVFLTPDKTSSRRHLLFVADRDPLAVSVGRTDMLDCKPRNIWHPIRFGKDERGRLVTLALMWVSVLVGAQPRKGKTFAARLLALYAALDPWVLLVIVDGKNSPDWSKFRLVAHRIVFGTHPNPNDDDPIGHLLNVLDEILAHIDRVNEQLAKLPVTLCPEGKLTEQLARDPRFPDLRVMVLVMEEFQVYFETEDQAVNKEIAAKLSRIQAVGPSAGVIILSSSQKPSGVGAGDVGRLFNRYRDNHAVRFALRCGNRLVSEAVLGGDAYAEGFDASSLPVGDEYRGVGYLYGMSDHTPTVRTFLADHGDAEKILKAARAHRERHNTLTGMAAGEDIARQVRDVLADVADAMAGETGLQWPTLAARLAERMPEHYADVTADALSAQLRALGVPSVDVKRDGQVLKGAKTVAVTAAINRRRINGE
ncbi:cell division protein FtsK [Actinopolymorpha sp. B9G3]|uniref:cell division protein FtsK n=1 Tax=Actinopolymorpha sp. B9G3 TaxID=3158970 RepID=UPI0032D8C65D